MRRRLLLLASGLAAALLVGPAAATPPGTWLSSDAVMRIARDWLTERLAGEIDVSALEPAGAPRELLLPPGDMTLNVTLQSGSVESGLMTVLVEAVVTDGRGGRASRSATVTFRINTLQDAVVAVRDLPRRTVVRAADVRVERRASSRLPAGAAHQVDQVVGKELSRSFAPGEVVTVYSLTAPLVIRRGSVVSLVVEGPNFKILARGIAAEDGALGAPIRVINQASRREVVGRVEDERTVRVPF